MQNAAELRINGKSLELPIVVGSEGEKAIDIRQLRAQTGYVTLDQGYMNTGAVTSNIAFIDGDAGILHYRGIPIEVLAEKSTFVEVAYLLIYGKLPTIEELGRFSSLLTTILKRTLLVGAVFFSQGRTYFSPMVVSPIPTALKVQISLPPAPTRPGYRPRRASASSRCLFRRVARPWRLPAGPNARARPSPRGAGTAPTAP